MPVSSSVHVLSVMLCSLISCSFIAIVIIPHGVRSGIMVNIKLDPPSLFNFKMPDQYMAKAEETF